ncbi:LytR C-terminal domain-containing protein [Glaciihabitans sp. dw_435]|uniref:LytR C-terminal domain-containing protein n=1 Tax=Glaciihabitans sp. dw_435 TaxID=2720081 RepID=UPI001BD40FF3|nr:LytR C-terminal domain-containing protein [Glaciihabitans sp. dw_435]
MATFPQDEFDSLPDDLLRVGAHRGPKVRGRGWIGFAWAALATGLLVVAGIFWLSSADSGNDFAGATSGSGTSTGVPTISAVPTAEPVLDPTTLKARKITVTVLNGSTTPGIQNTAVNALAAKKWTIGSKADASSKDVEKTYVYYSDAANEDAARGVAVALGIGGVRLSTSFTGAPLTLVLGADYAKSIAAG